MAYISRHADIPEKSVVVDTPKVIGGFFLFLIVGLIGIWLGNNSRENTDSSWSNPLVIILLLISFVAFIRMIINAKGIVIDVPENRLTFPGGGVDANSWIDYLKP